MARKRRSWIRAGGCRTWRRFSDLVCCARAIAGARCLRPTGDRSPNERRPPAKAALFFLRWVKLHLECQQVDNRRLYSLNHGAI
jgi:hypothetical protein